MGLLDSLKDKLTGTPKISVNFGSSKLPSATNFFRREAQDVGRAVGSKLAPMLGTAVNKFNTYNPINPVNQVKGAAWLLGKSKPVQQYGTMKAENVGWRDAGRIMGNRKLEQERNEDLLSAIQNVKSGSNKPFKPTRMDLPFDTNGVPEQYQEAFKIAQQDRQKQRLTDTALNVGGIVSPIRNVGKGFLDDFVSASTKAQVKKLAKEKGVAISDDVAAQVAKLKDKVKIGDLMRLPDEKLRTVMPPEIKAIQESMDNGHPASKDQFKKLFSWMQENQYGARPTQSVPKAAIPEAKPQTVGEMFKPSKEFVDAGVNPWESSSIRDAKLNYFKTHGAKLDLNAPLAPKTPEPAPTLEEALPGRMRERGFITSVKNADNISPEIREGVEGTYRVQPNVETMAEAKASVEGNFEAAVRRAKTSTTVSRQIQAESLDVVEKLQAVGRYEDAIEIVEQTSKRATEGGQASQILAMVRKLDPDGILFWAQKNIEKARQMDPAKYGSLTLDPAVAKGLSEKAAKIKAMAPGQARELATYELIDDVSRLVPTPWARKLTSIWKAGLLTGIKGAVGGSSVGNTANIIMRKLSDVPASGIDNAISVITGNRTKTFTLKGLLKGFGEGIDEGIKNFKSGRGAEDLTRKLDYNKVYFSTSKLGKAAQTYVDSVFNFYSAADRPFYHSALKNSLYDLSKAEGLNRKLSGKALNEFVENMVKNPTDDIITQAVESAQSAVFQNETAVGSALTGLKGGLKRGGSAGEIVSEVVAPFTGVPSAIATAVHQYSPTGAAGGILKALRASMNGNFTPQAQRALSESLGKGLTGTGVIWLGMNLVDSGQMTLGYPKDDGERTLWELEGKTPYSIKIGGKWRSLNYTGHLMSLMAIGGEINTAMADGGNKLKAIGSGALGSGKAILSSSPLQGMQAGMDAITDPQRYGDSYFRNLATSTVPTLVKDVASSGDRSKREVNTLGDAFRSKIPGMRQDLIPKRNIYGDEVPNIGPVAAIFDPFRSSAAVDDQTTSELRTLQDEGFGPTLSKPESKSSAFGQKFELTPEQLNQLEKETGGQIKSTLTELFRTPEYKQLDDDQKRELINSVINDIRKRHREGIVAGGMLGSNADPSTIGGLFPTKDGTGKAGTATSVNDFTVKILKSLPETERASNVISILKNPETEKGTLDRLVKEGVLSNGLINEMLMQDMIDVDSANALKKYIKDYKIKKGILKAPKGPKPKKVPKDLYKQSAFSKAQMNKGSGSIRQNLTLGDLLKSSPKLKVIK